MKYKSGYLSGIKTSLVGDVARGVESLPSKCKELGSNPRATHMKGKIFCIHQESVLMYVLMQRSNTLLDIDIYFGFLLFPNVHESSV